MEVVLSPVGGEIAVARTRTGRICTYIYDFNYRG